MYKLYNSQIPLENKLNHDIEKEQIIENYELKKQKLQFQLFGNDSYKREIVELYESKAYISYKNILLKIEVSKLTNTYQLSIFKSGINRHEIELLIDLPEYAEL